ncbi:hypothetical protein JCM16775_0568 [Leptotrichia hofstadii]|jgi:hypothetical protein cdivTM_26229|uniref:Uncharacterized protein n=1 Tax=Leptotrichia hofstadii TaxID=157688 RepID=A0A510JJ52_9FUSO|nr:hypothetical protein [Leptotrichia hofstadii]BBM37873.1 hypothetical protein JCM16775_0568 [Leptotrichia hofstadii]
MEEMKEKAKKSMEEAILEWADIELEIRCKRKMDIVMKELKSSREASNFFADLLVETQKTFFKLGKQVARMEMEQ